MSKVRDTITLYFKEGASDKFYTISVVDDEINGGSCTVPFVYGRRGSAGSVGDKAKSPVSYTKAKKLYDDTIAEKRAKGYTEGEGMKPYAGTAKESESTGVHCQLLTETPEKDIDELVSNPQFFCQEKFNGKRMLLRRTPDGKITAINRRGLQCGFPTEIEEEVKFLVNHALQVGSTSCFKDFVFDGECVGNVLHVFDALKVGGMDLVSIGTGFEERVKMVTTLLTDYGRGNHVRPVETARTQEEKASLVSRVKRKGGEGIVFRSRSLKYTAGLIPGAFKVKFWSSASCLVTKVNQKRSVALGLLDENDEVVDVGNCTIPANHKIPKKGSIVEVRYLYAHKGGSVYQPQYEGVRDDILKEACTLGQLKYKPEDSEDE